MRKWELMILALVLVSCSRQEGKKYVEVKKGDRIVKGYAINDTTFVDTVLYFNLKGQLTRKDFFDNGKLEGLSIDYHLNGQPKIVTNFSHGLKNGSNSYLDSLGQLLYSDYYYYELNVGPVVFYDAGNPVRYFFINLQNETLIDIDYRDWDGISRYVSNFINYVYTVQRRDSTREVSLLIYLPMPPKLYCTYSLLKKKTVSENEFVPILSLNSGIPFSNLVLPILPKDENYVVKLEVYDSSLNKKSVVYKDLW